MNKGRLEWTMTSWLDGRAARSAGYVAMKPEEKPRETQVVNLYPQLRFQEFQGFGAAITESVGSVLNAMPADQANAILEDCYGEGGLGYTWARVPIDSCDFSLSTYCAYEPTGEGPRINQASFQEHERTYIMPWLQKARDMVNGRGAAPLRLCMVPWSPPAFMKTNASRSGGGSLLPEHRRDWARYLCRYVQAYEESGFPVAFLGTQNEPNAAQTWDSCLYNAAEERSFLKDFLSPELARHGLRHVRLSAWDHNREGLYERVRDICSDAPKGLVSAAAFHWYSGDHFQALELLNRSFPELLLIFTEGCIEYSNSEQGAQLAHAQRYAHNIIGDLNHGAHAWIDWNLTLDSAGGPNYVGNYCDAPIMCSLPEGRYERRLSYQYLEHFTRNIVPGSVRIGMSSYTKSIESSAWLQPDGAIVLVVLNPGAKELPIALRCEGRMAELAVPANSILSARYKPA